VRSRRARHFSRGFTILEVLATIILIAILAVVLLPSGKDLMMRAGEAGCIANMRAITIGLRGYLDDHNSVWPQGPAPNDGLVWEDYWLTVLEPYGITKKTWQCPSFNAQLAAQSVPQADRPQIHYVPTMFPAIPGIADRWSTQPWLIERANAHKNGPHICFPDGSVKSFHKVLAEQGLR
jgi:prepilin-type N-terminal cleavage/methylation domain-containing protein